MKGRCSQIVSSPISGECMRRLEGPVENRKAKCREGHRDRSDVRIEQEAPHGHRDHFADRIGSEDDDQKKAPERQPGGEQERHPETDRKFEMDGEDDDAGPCCQSALQERRIVENADIIVETDESGRLPKRRAFRLSQAT